MARHDVPSIASTAAPLAMAVQPAAALERSNPSNRLLDVGQYRHEPLPLSDEMRWLRDLCGEVVQGGVYLLGGAPGGFKSGLALQLSLDLCRQGVRTLSILTEEPAHRLKERALRMTGQWPKADVLGALSQLQVETDLGDIEDLPRFIASNILSPTGRYHGVGLIVSDSIQGHGLSGSATRTYERLYEALRLTKSAGITTVLVSHVTKRGQIAGPRALEHNVDAVWLLRKTYGVSLAVCPQKPVRASNFETPSFGTGHGDGHVAACAPRAGDDERGADLHGRRDSRGAGIGRLVGNGREGQSDGARPAAAGHRATGGLPEWRAGDRHRRIGLRSALPTTGVSAVSPCAGAATLHGARLIVHTATDG